MDSSTKHDVHISHDVSEKFVEGADRSDSSAPANATISHDDAPNLAQELTQGEHISENVTTRHPARGDTDTEPSPAREGSRDPLAQLRYETELAELTVRKTSAELKAAEQRAALLELEWQTEDARSRRGSPPRTPPRSPTSPTTPKSSSHALPPQASHLGISEMSNLLQFLTAQLRDADARDA